MGAYVIKYAQRSNLHPIIAVAGGGSSFVETLIDRSKGDTIVDYRKGDAAVVEGIKEALKGQKLEYAFDAVTEKGSYRNVLKVLEPHGRLTTVLPFADEEINSLRGSVSYKYTSVGNVHENLQDLGLVHCRYLTRGLQEGWFRGHPHQVIPGGLEGVETALRNLKDGKASAVKYVFRISETPGLG